MKHVIRNCILNCWLVAAAGCGGQVDIDPTVETTDVALTATCAASTFGNCTPGSSIVTASADYKRVSAFALADANASVTKITAYIDGLGATSGTQAAMGIIYAADSANGGPGSLLCKTSQLVVSAGRAAAWTDLPISGACTLASAKTYYVGLLTSPTAGLLRYYGAAKTGALAVDANAFASGPSASFGTPSPGDVQMSIFASYTTTSVIAGTFGKTSPGAGMNTASGDSKRASAFALSAANVTVTKLTSYVDGLGATSGSQSATGVLYAADAAGGAPGTLLCTTTTFTINASTPGAWVDLPMTGTCVLPASGRYWLGLETGQPSGLLRYGYDTVTGALAVNANLFASGPSNPFGTAGSADVQVAIYATYTTGSTSAPGATVSPASLSFASQQVGATSAAMPVTVTNSGTASLALTAPSTSGDFSIASNSCPSSLAPGASCQIAVVFAPTASGTRNGALAIHDNAGTGSQTVALSGSATSGCTGTCYYVATTGSDANPGTAAAPFRHVSKAASVATAGATVIILDGTYDNEGVVNNPVVTLYNSGTASSPITFKAANRGKAILDAMNTATTDTCNGAYSYFDLKNAAFVVLDGFVLVRGCREGIHSNDSAHDIVIRHNDIGYIGNHTSTVQIGMDGIYLNNTEYNFTFDGNVFHDIGRTDGTTQLHFDHGIYTHATNVKIVNNVFYNMSKGWPIQLADGASTMLIANNTFAHCNPVTGEPGQVMFWGGNSNITLENNIFYQPTSAALARFQATVTATFDHNLISGGVGVIADATGFTIGTNPPSADPLFVHAAAPYDFHLQSSSPAIDVGATLSQVSTDSDGVSRPQGPAYDLGAYEWHP